MSIEEMFSPAYIHWGLVIYKPRPLIDTNFKNIDRWTVSDAL